MRAPNLVTVAGVERNDETEAGRNVETARDERDTAAARKVQDIAVPGDYVAEMARQIAVEQFGEKAYELGIRQSELGIGAAVMVSVIPVFFIIISLILAMSGLILDRLVA